VAAVDAVLKANIASILGLTLPSGAAFLLDTYTGAAAGYSVRRIASGATNLMRIREDSGDTETDIGYDSNGDLDTAAIATHCGSANGYVVTWYDQAGSNNATQSTQGNQPQIYNGTTQAVITENGKPAVYFTRSEKDILEGATFTAVSQPYTYLGVFKFAGTQESTVMGSTSTREIQFHGSQSLGWRLYAGTLDSGGTVSQNVQYLGYGVFDSPNSELHVNGAQIASVGNSGTGQTDSLSLGNTSGNSGAFNWHEGPIQEAIFYPSDQSSNRTGIETNINSEYLIYQPTDTPTSGLLATYSGAAAAYSVRQLADTAVISMTVRRDSDDEEKRFGFDENGDLDTAGIASFCGSANGYVSQWWDQSTNGNHASQGTAASQPQIYNGTAVVTENGKPALDFDGSNDLMNSPTMTVTDGEFMQTAVYVNDVNKADTAIATIDTSVRVAQTLQFPDTTKIRLLTFNSSGGVDEIIAASTTSAGTHTLATAHVLNGQGEVFVNGVGQLTGSVNVRTDQTNIRIGAFGANYADSRIQEVLHWPSEQTNRTDIESNINTYFSIY